MFWGAQMLNVDFVRLSHYHIRTKSRHKNNRSTSYDPLVHYASERQMGKVSQLASVPPTRVPISEVTYITPLY